LGTKLYNKLPNYIKNLGNLKPFKKKLKAFLLQQTFYSVDEYLSHVQAHWKWNCRKSMVLANKLLIK